MKKIIAKITVIIVAALLIVGLYFVYKYYYPPYLAIPESEIADQVVIKTNFGNMVVQIDKTNRFAVAQFTRYINSGFYDGMRFHRLVPDLLIETGDPITRDENLRHLWGQGGSNAVFKNETKLTDQMSVGTIAFSGSNLGTYGSHFLIVTKETPWLSGKHTIVGKLISGLSVLEKIATISADVKGLPTTDIIILSASKL